MIDETLPGRITANPAIFGGTKELQEAAISTVRGGRLRISQSSQ